MLPALVLIEGNIKQCPDNELINIGIVYRAKIRNGDIVSGTVINDTGTTVALSKPNDYTYRFTFGSALLNRDKTYPYPVSSKQDSGTGQFGMVGGYFIHEDEDVLDVYCSITDMMSGGDGSYADTDASFDLTIFIIP